MWKLSKIGLLILLVGCTDNFNEVYKSSSKLREKFLLHNKSTVEISSLTDIVAEGICIIEYVSDPNYLPVIAGIRLTSKDIYLPPGDQYITLLFFNNTNWRQVIFKSSELQISKNIGNTMTHKNYCKIGRRINLSQTPFKKTSFTTILKIEE